MTDQEILACLRRKLSYNQDRQLANESQARQAQARANLSQRICDGLKIDIARLESKITEAA